MYIYKAHEEDIITNNQIVTIKDFKYGLSWHIFTVFEAEIEKRKNIQNIFIEFIVNDINYITDFYMPNDKKLPTCAVYTNDCEDEEKLIDFKTVLKFTKHNGKDDGNILFKGYDLKDFDDDAEEDGIVYSKVKDLKISKFRIEYHRKDLKDFSDESVRLVLIINLEAN